MTWVHFKYIYHDTLPGWAITHHEATFYGGPTLANKIYIMDAGRKPDGPEELWAWHSMPVTRADWKERGYPYSSLDSPQSFSHLMPSRILEIDWRPNTKI